MTLTEYASRSWFWGPYSVLGLLFAVVALIADQLHKWWMLTVFDIQNQGVVAVTSFFNLVYVRNTGISFGLFAQNPSGQYWLAAFSFIVAVLLIVWLARSGDSILMAISVGLLIGGAIGNAIDRLHLGGVADFFDFHISGHHWPAFNIADAAIVAGVLGLLYDSFVASRNGAANRA
ncbi:MAG: signal peptidase II [Hyphomicrobiaceae bacterium]